jgi:hypothetical protein
VQVDHRRVYLELLLEVSSAPARDKFGQGAVGIVVIAEEHRLGRARLDAGGQPTGLYPVRTEGTLLDHAVSVSFICLLLERGQIFRKVGPFPFVHLENFKRTGINAGMVIAANTLVGLYAYNPAISHKDGSRGASLSTGHLRALHAEEGGVSSGYLGVLSFLILLNTDPRDVGTSRVLCLASDNACVTTRAAGHIYDQSVPGHDLTPF